MEPAWAFPACAIALVRLALVTDRRPPECLVDLPVPTQDAAHVRHEPQRLGAVDLLLLQAAHLAFCLVVALSRPVERGELNARTGSAGEVAKLITA